MDIESVVYFPLEFAEDNLDSTALRIVVFPLLLVFELVWVILTFPIITIILWVNFVKGN